jgi:hypothetical protein
MRILRIEKLAKLKKMAADSTFYTQSINNAETNEELDRIQQAFNANTGFSPRESSKLDDLVSEKRKTITAAGSTPYSWSAGASTYDPLLSGVNIQNDKTQYPPIIMGESRERYIQRARAGGSTMTDDNLGKNYDSMLPKAKAKGTTTPTAPKPQATRGVTKLVAPVGTKLQELSEEVVYNYLISGPLEFSYFTGKTPEDKTNEGSSKKVTSAYSKWEQAAKTLNTLWDTSGKGAAPSTVTPAATTAPAAPTEAVKPSETEVTADKMVSNVAKVLTDVYGGATYAGKTIRNEQGMVKKMMEFINSVAQSAGKTINSAETLAKIITPSIRNGLGRFSTADTVGLSEKDMEKTYRAELDLIMSAIRGLNDRTGGLGGMKGYDKLVSFSKELREMYPAYYASKAKKTKEASDSLDKKFIKAATLRRLKIRSQMEAAIDSSAQMGRARVF